MANIHQSKQFCPHCGTPIERMLSIKSCAKLFDCSEQFFRNLIREQRISHVKVEGMVRIPHSELEKLIVLKPSMDALVEKALLAH